MILSGSDEDQIKGKRNTKLRFMDSSSEHKKTKTFRKLTDYSVKTELDKKLLRGMFAEEGLYEPQQHPITQENMQGETPKALLQEYEDM